MSIFRNYRRNELKLCCHVISWFVLCCQRWWHYNDPGPSSTLHDPFSYKIFKCYVAEHCADWTIISHNHSVVDKILSTSVLSHISRMRVNAEGIKCVTITYRAFEPLKIKVEKTSTYIAPCMVYKPL